MNIEISSLWASCCDHRRKTETEGGGRRKKEGRVEEAQAGIKTAGRNTNNLRYADDTTLIAESEELKSLLMKVKEERKKLA